MAKDAKIKSNVNSSLGANNIINLNEIKNRRISDVTNMAKSFGIIGAF